MLPSDPALFAHRVLSTSPLLLAVKGIEITVLIEDQPAIGHYICHSDGHRIVLANEV